MPLVPGLLQVRPKKLQVWILTDMRPGVARPFGLPFESPDQHGEVSWLCLYLIGLLQ